MLGQKERGPSTRAALAQDDRRSQNRVPMRTTKERIRSALSEPSPASFAGEGVGEGLSRCSARKIGVLRLAQRSLRMTEEVRTAYRGERQKKEFAARFLSPLPHCLRERVWVRVSHDARPERSGSFDSRSARSG